MNMIKNMMLFFVVIVCGLYAYSEDRNEELYEWYVTKPYSLPEPGEYKTTRLNNAYFSNIFATLPAMWEYTHSVNGYLPCLDNFVHYKPKPLPSIIWTSKQSTECWTGHVHVVNENHHKEHFRLYSPWSCVRINGKYKAQSFDTPPGGTNILITYLPQIRKTNEIYGEILFEDIEKTTNTFDINFENADNVEELYSKIHYSQALSWQLDIAVHESPQSIYNNLENHSLLCAHRTWYSPVEQDAVLRIGCDDAVRVWHNGTSVFESARSQGYIRERYGVQVHLEKGTNRFLCVLINGTGAMQLGIRLYPSIFPLEDGVCLNDITAYSEGTPVYSGYPLSDYSHKKYVLLDYLWAPIDIDALSNSTDVPH